MNPLFQDTFVDVNETLLTAHTPQYPAGASDWSTVTGPVPSIQSNWATASLAGNATTEAIYTLAAAVPTFTLDFDYQFTVPNTGNSIVVCINAPTNSPSSGLKVMLSPPSYSSFLTYASVSLGSPAPRVRAAGLVNSDALVHHTTVVVDGATMYWYVDNLVLGLISILGLDPNLCGPSIFIKLVSAAGVTQIRNLSIRSLPKQAPQGNYWVNPIN